MSAKAKETPKFGLKQISRPDSGNQRYNEHANHPLIYSNNIESLKESMWTGQGLQVILSPSNQQ